MLLSAMLLLISSPLSSAQETTSSSIEPGVFLAEIVVESRKRKDDPKDVPFGLSVITGDDLEARGTKRVTDLVKEVPGLTSVGFGDGRSTNFHIRGIGSLRDPLSPDDTNVVVYVDGVPQPLFGADVAFLDLEQIEVLKGPQGTLYGRNASAGAINVTTRKPGDTKEFSGKIEVGEQGFVVGEAVASGPVVDGKLAARFAIRYSHVDGFVRNVLTSKDVGDREVFAGRATFQFTPTPETGITLSLSTDNDNRTFSFFLLRDTPDFPITSSFDANTSKRSINNAAVTVEHDLGAVDFTSVTGLTHLDTDDVFVDDSEGLIFARFTGLPVQVFAANDTFTDWAEERLTFSQEFRLNSKPTDEVSWVAGLAYFHSTFEADYFNRNAFFTVLNGARQNELTTNSYAAFGEATIPLGSDLKFTGGARLTHEEKSYDARFTGIGVPGTVDRFREAGDLTYDFVTGRASLSYDVTEETVAFATVSRGYKSGGFPRLVTNGGIGVATAPYSEATSWSFEAGLKYRSDDGRLGLDISAFRNDVEDEHVLVFDAPNFNFIPANVDVMTQGLELEGHLSLSSELKVSGGVSYTHAELQNVSQFLQATANAKDGNRPTNVPNFTSNLALSYTDSIDLPLAGDEIPIFANLSWHYIGDRPADVANSFFLDGYSSIDGRAGVELRNGFQVYAFARNLLDTTPELAGALLAPGIESVIPGRGRIVGAGISSKW